MDISAVYHDLVTIDLLNIARKLLIHLGVDVSDLEVINMPADSLLLSIYDSICHTWVVGIQLKPHILQMANQLLVEEKGCFK